MSEFPAEEAPEEDEADSEEVRRNPKDHGQYRSSYDGMKQEFSHLLEAGILAEHPMAYACS